MEIRIRETGNVVTEQEFRAMFPNTGFPVQLTEAIINDFGGDVVLEGPQAQPTRYQVAFRDGIEQREWRARVGFTSTPLKRPLLGFAGCLQFFTSSFHGDLERVELTVNRLYQGS